MPWKERMFQKEFIVSIEVLLMFSRLKEQRYNKSKRKDTLSSTKYLKQIPNYFNKMKKKKKKKMLISFQEIRNILWVSLS